MHCAAPGRGCIAYGCRAPVAQMSGVLDGSRNSTDVCRVHLLQVRDTLGALAERCASLKIDGAALHVSRLLHTESKGLAVKRITMYSPNWVKSQNRMSSTSNQACLSAPLSSEGHHLCSRVFAYLHSRGMLLRA